MFAGFQLDLSDYDKNDYKIIDFSDYQEEGCQHLADQKAQIETELERFIYNDGDEQTIDGTLLQENFFPQVEADIFISHSHDDKELADGVAGWLHREFGLRCFVDSNVWGCANTLLEELNTRYSDKRSDGCGGYLYSYEKCIAASRHVDMMLNIALQRMIDRTEAVFLLYTDKSVPQYGGSSHDRTYSPWIYSEIVCSDIVRKKPLWEYRPDFWLRCLSEASESFAHGDRAEPQLKIAYEVSTEHLTKLDSLQLWRWSLAQEEHHYKFPLDGLYYYTLGKEVENLRRAYQSQNARNLFFNGKGLTR